MGADNIIWVEAGHEPEWEPTVWTRREPTTGPGWKSSGIGWEAPVPWLGGSLTDRLGAHCTDMMGATYFVGWAPSATGLESLGSPMGAAH